MLRGVISRLWRRIVRNAVRAALKNGAARAELEQFVDERVRVQLVGPFELKRR